MTAATSIVPSWSLTGFHARVMMARDFNLFIVTEGTDTDPYFYSLVAKSSGDRRVRNVKTYAVHDVTRPLGGGAGARGKSAVVDAYKATRAARALTSVNSGGRRSIVFCVDRDVDDKHAPHESEMHFCVTTMRDVEAEIFANADAVTALAHVVSIDRADAHTRLKGSRDWIGQLGRLWADWIVLGCIAANATSVPPGVGWASHSLINPPRHGKVDRGLRLTYEARVQSALGSRAAMVRAKRAAKTLLRANIAARGHASIVKGKWLPVWFASLMATTPGERPSIESGALVAFAGALDYGGSWADHYRFKFDEAMSRRSRPR